MSPPLIGNAPSSEPVDSLCDFTHGTNTHYLMVSDFNSL